MYPCNYFIYYNTAIFLNNVSNTDLQILQNLIVKTLNTLILQFNECSQPLKLLS